MIVLCAVAYFLIGIVFASSLRALTDFDDGDDMLLAIVVFAWPTAALVCLIIGGLKAAEWVGKEIKLWLIQRSTKLKRNP